MYVYRHFITTHGQVQPTGLLSKVSVKIALSKHQLTWALRDSAGIVLPSRLKFQGRKIEAANLTGPPAPWPQPAGPRGD